MIHRAHSRPMEAPTPVESAGPAGSPEVSIVVACRNGLPYLRECLDSLASQTFAAWELILVDGASTDGSAELAAGYGPRVRVLPAPDRPVPGVARNRGVALARARLLAFVDADDRWRPDKLERQVGLLRATGATLVYSDCRVVDARGRILGRYHARHRPAEGAVAGRLSEENFVPLCTVLVTRDAFARAGGFPEGYWAADDYVFLLRAAELGTFAYDPEPLADYRVHPGSVTRDFRRAYRENMGLFAELLRGAADEPTRARARRAQAIVGWRWAMREAALGRWGRAWELAGEAVRATGPSGAASALLAALAWWLRGLPVRVRMARARRG